MGLLTTQHFHTHKTDNSTHYPEAIHEHKAPTDESVRLLNEMQDKAIQNLIAKVEVKDNLVEGVAWAMGNNHSTMDFDVQLFFKFKINGQEFVVEKKIRRSELYSSAIEINNIEMKLRDHAKSVMLWYALKSFVAVAYEQITNQKVPEYLLTP